MKVEKLEIAVPGQRTGPALLTGFLLDSISVAPDKLRPAIVVCAGGGYWNRSDRESEPIAMQFLSMGYHAFILDYSVSPNHFPTSLKELAEAVARIRDHGKEWKVDAEKVIVCGFSAAGHLACSLGVFWNREMIYRELGRSSKEIRPDGMILCYPVITGGEFRHEGSFNKLLGENATEEERMAVSLELFVSKDTPKAFIWHTYTDETVPLENSLLLASALRKQGVNFELHIYPTGGHGLSLANEETTGSRKELLVPQCQSWISLVKTWLENF